MEILIQYKENGFRCVALYSEKESGVFFKTKDGYDATGIKKGDHKGFLNHFKCFDGFINLGDRNINWWRNRLIDAYYYEQQCGQHQMEIQSKPKNILDKGLILKAISKVPRLTFEASALRCMLDGTIEYDYDFVNGLANLPMGE